MTASERGFIAVCWNDIQDECLEKLLFGSTLDYKDKVLQVKRGDIGFLYNLDTDILYGVFRALTDGRLHIESGALKGNFPAQIKVDWYQKFEPITEAKNLFKKLKINFGDFLLSSNRVNQLWDEFRSNPSKKDDFRKKFPTDYRVIDGHYVRTKSETIIDNWLYNNLIVHSYERKVPIEEDLYCDFYIPKLDFYIEYWGLTDDCYLVKKSKQRELYQKNGLKLDQFRVI